MIKPSTLSFSHMIYLLNHVTCLSNTSKWLHESPRNGLEEAFGGKIYPIFIQFFSTGLKPLQKCKIKDLVNPLRCSKVFYVDFCHEGTLGLGYALYEIIGIDLLRRSSYNVTQAVGCVSFGF